ncbi:unnamed protein product, partial [Rotaria magnacalcarata]
DVSLVTVVVVGVVTVFDDVKQGVFITSRNMFGIEVDFVVTVDEHDDDDDSELESTIDAFTSVITVVDALLATSSITSSM